MEESYRLPPVLFAIHAPPGRDRFVAICHLGLPKTPSFAKAMEDKEAWSLEAFVWRRVFATVISRYHLWQIVNRES